MSLAAFLRRHAFACALALLGVGAAAALAFLPHAQPVRDFVAGGAEALAPPIPSIVPSDMVPDEGPGTGPLSSDAGAGQAILLALLLSGGMVAVVLVGRSAFLVSPGSLASLVPDSLPAQKAALEHLQRFGVGDAAQLLSFDPQALAFWSGLPAAQVAELQELVRLLEWPEVPRPTARRLAEAGVGSIPALAVQEPEPLSETLRQMGPRASDLSHRPEALAGWIGAAQRHVARSGAAAGPAVLPLRRGPSAAMADGLASA